MDIEKGSLYLYRHGGKPYAVEIIDIDGDEVTIEFVARMQGQKGRWPKIKKVKSEKLLELYDSVRKG